MKHQSIVPLRRSRFPRIIFPWLTIGALVAPLAAAQTFTRTFVIGPSTTYLDKTSTSFTQTYADGEIDVTGNGLALTYQNLTTGSQPEWLTVTNIGDITAGGVPLNRYLSFSLGPENFDDLAGYSGPYSVEITRMFNAVASVDNNEFFEIRTSLDNFAAPLVTWGGVLSDGSVYRAPGLTVAGPNLNTNGNVITTDAPLEIRLYSWYNNPGGDGTIGVDEGPSQTGFRFNYTVTVVPEPSAALLLGAAGSLALLRRRRA